MRKYSDEAQHSDHSAKDHNSIKNNSNNNSRSQSPKHSINLTENTTTTNNKRKLFVKNLSYSTKEHQMEEFFSKYGAVTNCFILQRNGRSKGCGFIEFENEDIAQKVLHLTDDELELDGRKIGVSPAEDKKERHNQRERSRDKERDNDRNNRRYNQIEKTKIVFVGNLSYDSTQQTIEEFFADCGSIESIRIAMDNNGKMKGFCHIAFENEEFADKAIEKNGKELDGRLIKVDKALPRGEGRNDKRYNNYRRGGNDRGRFNYRNNRDNRRRYDNDRDKD